MIPNWYKDTAEQKVLAKSKAKEFHHNLGSWHESCTYWYSYCNKCGRTAYAYRSSIEGVPVEEECIKA
jgi:hypothetical protein